MTRTTAAGVFVALVPALLVVGVGVGVGVASPAFAQSADEIVARAKSSNSTLGFSDATATVALKVTTKSGEVRLRQLAMKNKKSEGLSRSIVRFTAPAEVAGAAFLALENKGRDNDQFLYLPALGKTKRITVGQRSQSFMGTDFSYADFDSKYLNDVVASRLADDTFDGVACFVVESKPKTPEAGEYGRAKLWVDKTSSLVRQVEFYDKADALWKVLRVVKTKVVDGRTVVSESVMRDVKRGSSTQVNVGAIDFKVKVDDSELTEKALSRG